LKFPNHDHLYLSCFIKKAEILLAHPSTSSFLGVPIRNNPTARRSFKSLVEWMRSVGIPQLYRIHLAFFYIFGVYYNISRRVSGIKYLSLNPQSDLKALKVYKFLGYLTLTQTALSLILWVVSTLGAERNSLTSLKNSNDEKEGDISHPWFKCSVCLESKSPSATSCGHLFCWTCIQEHAWTGDGEARCPHCRALFEPSQVMWRQPARHFCNDVCHHPELYFSGIQPTGVPHLGNYFGFIEPWTKLQKDLPSSTKMILAVADQHAISLGPKPPTEVRELSP
uniref:RING-type E3 ubiquitin transferase n=1 Tax=Haemonchus placei TaxID=6290 RepID=A0A0N4VUM5_HAEPC